MSETRKYCCYGLFSLEKGSVIIAIFGLIISISALFGHIWIVFNPRIATYGIPFYYHYYIEKASGISVIILVDIILNVLFNSMLIYGVSKERSAYLPPWMILYVLNLLPVSELLSKITPPYKIAHFDIKPSNLIMIIDLVL